MKRFFSGAESDAERTGEYGLLVTRPAFTPRRVADGVKVAVGEWCEIELLVPQEGETSVTVTVDSEGILHVTRDT